MKSIRYVAITSLIVGAHMYAMNNNNNNNADERTQNVINQVTGKKRSFDQNQANPFAEMSSFMQQSIKIGFEQAEIGLTNTVQAMYNDDMHSLSVSLNSTHHDHTQEFPTTGFYKVENNSRIYSIPLKPCYFNSYESGFSRFSGYYEKVKENSDPHTRSEWNAFLTAITNADGSYKNANGSPKEVDRLPILRGDLAKILLVHTVLKAAQGGGKTPDEIRNQIAIRYREYSKANRRYYVGDSKISEPVSDERLNTELAALEGLKFSCTLEKVAELTSNKLMPTLSSPSTDYINSVSRFLMQKACINYHNNQNLFLKEELTRKYTSCGV